MSDHIKVVTPEGKDVPVAWDIAARIVQAEETVRALARQKPIEIPKREVPKTQTLDKKGFPIRGDYSLLDISNRGELREVLVKSPSSAFSVLVLADGVRKLERSFSDLQDIAEELEFLSAFEKDGVYVLSLKSFSWLSNFLFLIHTDTAITFTRLFAVWNIYVK